MSCPVSDRTFPPLAHRVASDRGRRAVDKTWKSPTRLARSPHTKPGATCPLDLGTKTVQLKLATADTDNGNHMEMSIAINFFINNPLGASIYHDKWQIMVSRSDRSYVLPLPQYIPFRER